MKGQGATDQGSTDRIPTSQSTVIYEFCETNQSIMEPVPGPHVFCELRTARVLTLFVEELGDNICNSDLKNNKRLSQT